jgi:hypothetical protein
VVEEFAAERGQKLKKRKHNKLQVVKKGTEEKTQKENILEK